MKKLRDNRYRLFGFLNPMDVLLAAGIIALVYAAASFAAPKRVSARPEDPVVRYTVELNKKEAGFHEKVVIGATLYDTEKGYEIGVVTDVYATPYLEDAGDAENGVIRRTPVEGMEFTYIVVESPAQVSEYATLIGQYDIMVNKVVFVKSKTFAGTGYITAIEQP